jgi:predicted nucleotide-binding protein
MVEKDQPKYWHVIVQPKQPRRKQSEDAVATDQDREWVESRILEPRRQGKAVVVGGKQFDWSEIERLRITVSDIPTADIVEEIKAEDRVSSVAVLGGPSYRWRAAARSRDVTDELVVAPVGTSAETGAAASRVDPKKVMVVLGRNAEANQAMFDFLRALRLDPQEWGKLVGATGKAAPYVGEVLEHAFEDAAAVVVLFTPDDEARLRPHLHGPSEEEYDRNLTPQARPNVLFEAGMALGVHPDRTILVELGELRPFSDIYGRHVVRLDGTAQPLRDIVRRLRVAGCDVDDSGDDWARPDRFPDPGEGASQAETPSPPTTADPEHRLKTSKARAHEVVARGIQEAEELLDPSDAEQISMEEWHHRCERWDARTKRALQTVFPTSELPDEFGDAATGSIYRVVGQGASETFEYRKQAVRRGIHVLKSIQEQLEYFEEP